MTEQAGVNEAVPVGQVPVGQEPVEAEVPIGELEDQICELAAHIDAATGRFLEMLASFDAREGWAIYGIVSCAHWLSWRCGLSLGAAREKVRVARALRSLPVIAAGAATGELSYAKVRALSRVALPETEAEMVELARYTTASQCERLVRCYRRAIPAADAAEAGREAFDRRYLDTYFDDDGSLVVRARISASSAAVVLAALDAAVQADLLGGPGTKPNSARDVPAGTSEAQACAPDPAPDAPDARPTATQRRADALVELAQAWLASAAAKPETGSETGPDTGRPRHEVVIHVDAAVLANDDAGGLCHAQGAGVLVPPEVRRFACDADIRVATLGANGTPMDIGRRSRAIPVRLRRALGLRDAERCRFPGCSNRIVDAHHVWHWTRGGPTNLANLVLVCRRHHSLVHEGGWTLAYEPATDTVSVRRPDLELVPVVPAPSRPDGDIEASNAAAGVRPGPQTCASLGWGERMDYSMAVEGWLQINGHLNAA